MITVTLEMTFFVSDPDAETHDLEGFDAHTDEVFEALLAVEQGNEQLADADLEANLAHGIVTLRITGSAETYDDVLDLTGGSIRAAIHAAGGATSGWKSPADPEANAVIYQFKSLSTV